MQFARKRWELYALAFIFGIGLFTIASILIRFSFVIDIVRNNARFSRWMAVECMCMSPLTKFPYTMKGNF
jgi:hypothetical protein